MDAADEKDGIDRILRLCMQWGPAALILFGVLARVMAYVRYRVLWLDESYTGVTIVENGYAAFFAPLDHFQIVPPFYLSFAKFCTQLLGEHEYALRLPAFLAAIAAIGLFWCLASRVADRLSAMLALAFFVTSGMLIYYAAECKPYALDVLIAVALMLMAWRAEQVPRSVRVVALLALAGAVAVWCSFPAAFVLAGVGGAQLIAAIEARDFRRFVAVLPAWCAWAGSFLLLYFLVVRPGLSTTTTHHAQDLDAVMQESWKFGFLPFPPENLGELRWYKEQFARVFYTPGGFGSWVTGLAAFVAVLGAWSFLYRSRFVTALIFLPALVALAASLLKLYPFDGRMILFLLPAMYLAMGEGISFLVRHMVRNAALPVGALALALLLAPPGARAALDLVRAEERHELDATLAHMQQHWESGDRVYFSYYDALVFRLAAYWFEIPDDAVYREGVAWEYQDPDAREIDRFLEQVEDGGRVWLPLAFHIRDQEFLTHVGESVTVTEVPATLPPLYTLTKN